MGSLPSFPSHETKGLGLWVQELRKHSNQSDKLNLNTLQDYVILVEHGKLNISFLFSKEALFKKNFLAINGTLRAYKECPQILN